MTSIETIVHFASIAVAHAAAEGEHIEVRGVTLHTRRNDIAVVRATRGNFWRVYGIRLADEGHALVDVPGGNAMQDDYILAKLEAAA